MITQQSPPVTRMVRDRDRLFAERKREEFRKLNPHRPFADFVADGAWADQQCFILGGGPSLEGFDFESLRGKGRIIAINRAYENAPFADILYFMDNKFYQWVHKGELSPGCLEAWNSFPGYKVFLNIMGREFDDVYSIRSLGRVGLSNSIRKGLYHGNNSGVGAIGLAYCLKADPIYLLGIDCRIDERRKKSHYHSGYAKQFTPASAFQSFKGDFERLNRFLRQTTTSVINLNPHSALKCFPFSTIDEVLGNGIEIQASEGWPMDEGREEARQDNVL
jgi:hypothetical protein